MEEIETDILPEGFKSYIDYAKSLVEFLNKYTFLYNYIQFDKDGNFQSRELFNTFLLSKHWEKRVPKEWRESLEDYSTLDLIKMVSNGACKDGTCESIVDYVKTAKKLKLNEKTFEMKYQKKNFLDMNVKKIHEVNQLSNLILNVAENVKCKNIIDIGCGKGYLSKILGEKYNVLGIDRNEQLCSHMNEKSKELNLNLNAITTHLSLDLSVEDFLKILKKNKVHDESKMIIGLHTCGDLAATIIKLYVESGSETLINVGCCYDGISGNFFEFILELNVPREKISKVKANGYPMSDFLKKNRVFLGSGKMLSTLSLNSWTEEKIDYSIFYFKKHSFRMAFDVLMNEPTKTLAVKVNPKNVTKFSKYAQTAIDGIKKENKRLTKDDLGKEDEKKTVKIDDDLLKLIQDETKMEEFYAQFRPNKDGIIQSVQCYWSLRALLGPIIEALVLVDRILYLHEQGRKAYLLRIFEYKVSPRSVVIISHKK